MSPATSDWNRLALLRGCLLSGVLALGCSGRVDLGGVAVGSRPDPTTSDAEVSAHTESVMKLNGVWVLGLAADENDLYLATIVGTGPYYLQRCDKKDCWRTLTPVAAMGQPYSRLEHHSERLGWVNDYGLQLCHLPDCRDVKLVQGTAYETGSTSPLVWDDQYVYWVLWTDRSIYRCELPNCERGPELFAHTTAPDLELIDGKLYWFDGRQGVLRMSTDGTQAMERLTMEQQTTWTTTVLDSSAPLLSTVVGMQLDGPWAYAAVASSSGLGEAGLCDGCNSGVDLARWRYDDTGAAREWVLTDDAAFDALSFVRVFDGEVVWATGNGDLWSCLADNCGATKRQLGVDGNVKWNYETYVVADEDFIYWLSAPCDNTGICGYDFNVKRTPRIAK